MIVERKVKKYDMRYYAYVGCFPGGDILLVDRDGKLSITHSRQVTVVAGQELVELEAHSEKLAGERVAAEPITAEAAAAVRHAAEGNAFGLGVGEDS